MILSYSKDKIMVILSRFPYPLEKGDKLRAYYQLIELSKFYDVTLIAISEKKPTKSSIKEVEKVCNKLILFKSNWFIRVVYMIRSLFGKMPFQTGYFFSYNLQNLIKQELNSNNYKHIYCQLIRTTELVKNIHEIPKTLDYMDTLSAGLQRRIELQPFYKKWLFKLEAKRVAEYERKIFDYFENKTIISEQDRDLINRIDNKNITIIPNGIANRFFESLPKTHEFEFVFTGNMSYPPNIEAVEYIHKNILSHYKTFRLLVAGANPHPRLIKLAQSNNNIVLTGWVDDIRNEYVKGKIFLAPMMIGTGMQNKLLEAMALEVPCITTTLANCAIGAKKDIEILVGDTPEEIISLIDKLLINNELRDSIALKGKQFVKEKYDWENSTQKLINLIKSSSFDK